MLETDTSRPWPYLIGDIHGCYAELLELEARIHQHARQHGATPLLVSVGDLIDRGPDSAGVVAHFMRGQAAGTHTAILGNHEVMMLQLLHHLAPANFQHPDCAWPLHLWTLEELHMTREGMACYLNWNDYHAMMKGLWLGQGGHQTLASFGLNPHDVSTWLLPPEVLRYLLQLPFYWQNEQGVATHALAEATDLTLIRALSENELVLSETVLRQVREATHSLLWNRNLPKGRPDRQRQHISGHTPMGRLRRWKLLHCAQIDTGCVYGRRLTAYCLPLDQGLSVPAQRNYVA
ncbi:MAG: metallophosphoesterase [Candidatus Sericytochromatia bacterium]